MIAAACDSSGPADALSCSVRNVDSVQILVGRLDAGLTSREAYRLSADGEFSYANWNDNNQLLATADFVLNDQDAYLSALNTLSSIESTEARPTDDGTTLSPSVLTIEIAIAQSDQPTDFRLIDESTSELDVLIENWVQKIQQMPAEQGTYVWTMAAPSNLDETDITIAQPDCEEGLVKDVNSGFLGPAVVTRVTDNVDDFLSDGRSRYTARSINGFVFFGILSSP